MMTEEQAEKMRKFITFMAEGDYSNKYMAFFEQLALEVTAKWVVGGGQGESPLSTPEIFRDVMLAEFDSTYEKAKANAHD